MSKPPIRALLIDFDCTIRHWTGRGEQIVEANLGFSPGAFGSYAYGTSDHRLAQLGVITDREWRRRLAKRLGLTLQDLQPWIDDRGYVDDQIIRFLERLKTRIRVAVVSDTTDIFRSDLAHFGLENFFDAVYCSTNLGLAKPAPALFKRIATEMKLDAQSIYFTDDISINVTSAKSVGFTASVFDDTSNFQKRFLRTCRRRAINPLDIGH